MLKIALVLFKIYVLIWKKGINELVSLIAPKHTAILLLVLENYMGHKISTMPEKWKHAHDKEENLFMNLSKAYKQFAESRY